MDNTQHNKRGDSSHPRNSATVIFSDDAEKHSGVPSSEWRRFKFFRSWMRLQLPVIAVTLAGVVLFVALIFSTAATGDVVRMLFSQVDPHGEMNVSTWVNAGLWQIAGLLAGYYTLRVEEHRRSWAAVAALCFYFSLDETVRLHEHLNMLLSGFGQQLPVATFVWVIPGALIALLIAALLLRMVLSLPRTSRNGLLAGGCVFVLGSLGLESVEGFIYYDQGENSIFVALGVIEEALEMTGVTLAIAAMLHLLEWRRTGEATSYRINTRRDANSLEHG